MPLAVADLGPDSLVGSYRIVKEIGRGGMGTVYEALHTVLPRRAAVKVMHGELRRQPGMATRMVQEASILEEVRHPGVVRVYECNVLPDHRPWIAMELVQGETLASRLHYASRLRPIEVATLLSEVADVLASVHARGVVHRDIKPDNLLLTPTDRDFPLRLVDWGVARLGPVGRLTLDGMTPGTPIYMSPEQAIGKDIGPPCDLYSLGVIAYEALTGHPPFDGRTLAEVVSMHLTSEAEPLATRCSAPPALCQLVHRLLDKHQSLRPVAIEVRQITRSLVAEMSSAAYEEMEVSVGGPTAPQRGVPRPPVRTPVRVSKTVEPRRVRRPPAVLVPTDEVAIVDPELLELGTTEMMPVVPKPRWTPELSDAVPQIFAASRSPITPKSARDQVSGEILAKRR